MRLPYGRHRRGKAVLLSGSRPLESTSNANPLTLTFTGTEAYGEDQVSSLGTILHSFFFRSLGEHQSF